ncbi:enoyl-CoA hydratase-related protein [Rhodococcus sp. NCIMB 12038]|uniref:enoyl-CoA hydratase-related protein n=1 Tax=Rhodococcus sp. NCIMB 12038 TaxID=933800 RepID=UPI000B3C05BB|nr:enoyl-CoA hydratase-related protein [Rhodococcus sp. NCIMB 12038]OUS93967.1 enoyl-CoA hydratase [Rhodococcus sp. NCIMB 12038]
METIQLDVTDHIATITLDRPRQLNALTEQMVGEIIAAFDHCDDDDYVRAIVVTGRGRAFCAGADLSAGGDSFAEWLDADEDPISAPGGIRRDGGGRIALRIYESRKPVIVAINGIAVGGGITFTLPGDIRLASSTAKLGFVFTQRGLVPESCSSWFLPRVVGTATALEWVITGRLVSAEEACAKGLVHAVYPPESLLDEAYVVARHIATRTAPVSVALSRQMLWRSWELDHPMRAHEIETHAVSVRGKSDDIREGVASFLDKRKPEFSDRVSSHLPDLFTNLPTVGYTTPRVSR